jgi:hypothetical protein
VLWAGGPIFLPDELAIWLGPVGLLAAVVFVLRCVHLGTLAGRPPCRAEVVISPARDVDGSDKGSPGIRIDGRDLPLSGDARVARVDWVFPGAPGRLSAAEVAIVHDGRVFVVASLQPEERGARRFVRTRGSTRAEGDARRLADGLAARLAEGLGTVCPPPREAREWVSGAIAGPPVAVFSTVLLMPWFTVLQSNLATKTFLPYLAVAAACALPAQVLLAGHLGARLASQKLCSVYAATTADVRAPRGLQLAPLAAGGLPLLFAVGFYALFPRVVSQMESEPTLLLMFFVGALFGVSYLAVVGVAGCIGVLSERAFRPRIGEWFSLLAPALAYYGASIFLGDRQGYAAWIPVAALTAWSTAGVMAAVAWRRSFLLIPASLVGVVLAIVLWATSPYEGWSRLF